jgi:drug/metabolite transporter (DMT)-like permease
MSALEATVPVPGERERALALGAALVTVGLGWPLLGEVPRALAIAGGTLSLAGVCVARRR